MKAFGSVLNLGTTLFTVSGDPLAGGESITGVTLTSVNGYAASTTQAPGMYPNEIDPSSATGSGGFDAANYCITYVKGKLTILPPQFDTIPSNMTNSSLMCFDTDANLPGRQFNLIHQQDSANGYVVNSTNPGQFYDNILYTEGVPGSMVTLTFRVPYPFITQGANPIHVYSGVSVTGTFPCVGFTPGTDISSGFTMTATGGHHTTSGSPALYLGDTVGNGRLIGTSYGEVTVTGTMPASGVMYANIHLDFGFKRMSGFNRADLDSDGVATDSSNPNILGAPAVLHGPETNPGGNPYTSGQPYHLSGYANNVLLCGPGNVCEDIIYSVNLFKKSVGVAGTVTDQLDNGLPGYTLKMFNSSNVQVGANAPTDGDGAYYINYKSVGGNQTYTVKLYLGTVEVATKTVTIKSNGFGVVNFQITP